MYNQNTRRNRFHKIQKRKKSKFKYTISLYVLIGLILFISLILLDPEFHIEEALNMKRVWWFDVMQHIIFFYFVCLILFRLLSFQRLNVSFFLFIFLFSAFFELLQTIIYEVSFSYHDVISNLIGISLAFLTKLFITHLKRRKKKRIVQLHKK